jgi:hypothetical protein
MHRSSESIASPAAALAKAQMAVSTGLSCMMLQAGHTRPCSCRRTAATRRPKYRHLIGIAGVAGAPKPPKDKPK